MLKPAIGMTRSQLGDDVRLDCRFLSDPIVNDENIGVTRHRA
jgi:hypothetical protein